MKIMLVEDDLEQALLFARVLRMVGYHVETAGDAQEAQALMSAESFALLLADWDLPSGMQGDALIIWARAHDSGIKTILFSNHPQVVEIAAACGADAAFRKTDGIIKLRQLVNTLAPLETGHA